MFKLLALAALLAGCIHLDPDSTTTSEDQGAVEVTLPAAPDGVDCIALTFANEDGVTTTAIRAFSSGTLVIRNLAAGAYSLSAAAYASGQPAPITDDACSPVPLASPWNTEAPSDVVIDASRRTNTALRLVRSGNAGVTPIFVDTPVVLAQGQGALGLIAAANGTIVYIHTGNATTAEVRRTHDLPHGSIETLASGQSNPSEIVLDPTTGNVFWTNFQSGAKDSDGHVISDGSVWEFSGGVAFPLHENVRPSDISILGDGRAVWGQEDTSTIECSGCSAPFVVPPGEPNALGASATNVFVDDGTHGGDISSYDTTGAGGVILATGGRIPIGISADDTNIYWTDYVAATGTGGVLAASVLGGPASLLVDDIAPGFPVAAIAGHVYWADGARVARVPIGGGDVEDVVVGPIGGFALSHDDEGHAVLFWTDNSHGGLVWRARIN